MFSKASFFRDVKSRDLRGKELSPYLHAILYGNQQDFVKSLCATKVADMKESQKKRNYM